MVALAGARGVHERGAVRGQRRGHEDKDHEEEAEELFHISITAKDTISESGGGKQHKAMQRAAPSGTMKNATEKGDRWAASLRESGDIRDKERKLVFRHAENRKSFPANRTAHSLSSAVQTAKRPNGDTETAGKDGVILLVQEEQHETLFFRVRQCTTTFHLRDGDTKQHTAVAFFIVPQEREKRNTKRCNEPPLAGGGERRDKSE